MDTQSLYLHTKPSKLFFKAALPGAVSMLAAMLYSFFDGMFVGQILGETAFAAVNLAMPFVIINFSLADLVGVGSAVPISIHLGAGEEDEANNYFTVSCLLIVLTGILMGVAMYFGAAPLMGLMGAEGELKRLAAQYLQVYAICSPLTTITFAMDNYLRICGKIKGSMWLNVFMSVLTVLLEFVCLFVLKMGVWGAALASSVAMIVCAAIAFIPFARGRLQLHLRRPRFNTRIFRQILAAGSPNFLSNVAGRLTSIVMNAVLLYMGGQSAITLFGVMMYAGDIVQPLLYGICDSLQPAIGYNYGAGEMKRVKSIEKCVLIASATVSAAMVTLMFCIPDTLAALFLQPTETELLSRAATVIRLYSLTFVTRWFAFAIQSLFVALDRPVPATALSLGNALIFPLILIVALWPMGLNGLWLNAPLTSVLVTLLAGVLLIRIRKKGLSK